MKRRLLTTCIGLLAAGFTTSAGATDRSSKRGALPSYAFRSVLQSVTPEGDGVSAETWASPRDPRFDGHFDGLPIMPGNALLDTGSQVARLWTRALGAGADVDLLEVKNATFHEAVKPGDELIVELKRRQYSESPLVVTGTIRIASEEPRTALEIGELAVGAPRAKFPTLKSLGFRVPADAEKLSFEDIVRGLPHGGKAVHLNRARVWSEDGAMHAEGTTQLTADLQPAWALELIALLGAELGRRTRRFNPKKHLTALHEIVLAEFLGGAPPRKGDTVISRADFVRRPQSPMADIYGEARVVHGKPFVRAHLVGIRLPK